jgi:DNA modification methylase
MKRGNITDINISFSINHMCPSIRIVNVPINSLRPAPYNPRKWDEAAKENLRESIRRFGAVDPLIVNSAPNRKNVVIGGHFRLETMKELGFTEVPVVYLSIPSIRREKELNMRLNRNTGEFDLEKLKSFDADFLLKIGFDDSDLASVWDDALEAEDDQFDVDAALKRIKKPKSKLGDLYEIAGHRIICGDATDRDVVHRLVGRKKINMLYSDPPYNIALDYGSGISTKGKYGGKTDDRKTDEEYRTFLSDALANGLSACGVDCHVFTYCDQKYIGLLQSLYVELGVDFKRVALWIKNNFNMTPQVAFNKCYEPVIYGTHGRPYLSPRSQNFTEILNREIGCGNRTIDDILDILDIWLCKRLPAQDYEHPTAKNPVLHERPLRRCTKPGDNVLDLFGGSGSTLIAAHQMKRRCFLVEWDPVFVDVILQRFEAAFSIAPTLLRP